MPFHLVSQSAVGRRVQVGCRGRLEVTVEVGYRLRWLLLGDWHLDPDHLKGVGKEINPNTTGNNQRLGSAFDDLNPRLSLLCDVIRPAKKSAEDARYMSQGPSLHSHNRCCPIQSWIQSILGVHFSYVKRKKYFGTKKGSLKLMPGVWYLTIQSKLSLWTTLVSDQL